MDAMLGDRARFVHADVAHEDEVKAAIAMALDVFGGLHGVVNCAGIAIAEKVLGKRGVHDLWLVYPGVAGQFNRRLQRDSAGRR